MLIFFKIFKLFSLIQAHCQVTLAWLPHLKWLKFTKMSGKSCESEDKIIAETFAQRMLRLQGWTEGETKTQKTFPKN